jgi:hypothetical protein
MSRNRKAFIDYVCHYLDKLLPGGENGKYMRERLEAMSPEQLDGYVAKLASGEETLPLIAPNLHDKKMTIPNNLAIAKELGVELFEQLRLTDPDTGQTYITNEKYLVMDIPVRRQRQLQRKKTSIPQGTRQVDDLSGQVTGMAKGSKVSMPELQVLYSQELTDPIIELIKYRGGDIKGQQLLYRSLMETGRASQRALSMTPTTVRSTQILSIVLNAMHLSTTLMD